MKFKPKGFSVVGTASTLVGGGAAGFVGGFIPLENQLIKNGIVAVIGAGLSAFGGGSEIVKGLGNGMLGYAGGMLTAELIGGSSEPAASGLGNTWQSGVHAMGNLPGQNAMGNAKRDWIVSRTTASASTPVPKVVNMD